MNSSTTHLMSSLDRVKFLGIEISSIGTSEAARQVKWMLIK